MAENTNETPNARVLKESSRSMDVFSEIDVFAILKAIWRKIWLVILAAVMGGLLLFFYSTFFITPVYQASALLYVNSSSISIGSGSFSISAGELSTANRLISTYSVILKSRFTLEKIVEKAELGKDHISAGQLSGMISSEAVNNTEVFRVTVRASQPELCEKIANTVADVLPERISDIMDGCSMRVVDYAVKPTVKSSPDITRNTTVGVLLGVAISCVVIILIELLDDQVHGSDFLTDMFQIPILAETPTLGSDANRKRSKDKGYRYYYSSGASSNQSGGTETK